MRIVSLLPSATEILFALGLGDFVVGVTHECDYPAEARSKPKVTSSLSHEGRSSREIDELVRSQLTADGSIYSLDVELLETLRPDVILTQRLCTVCAVSIDKVREVASQLSSKPHVANLEPHTMPQVFETFRRIAWLCGKLDESVPIIESLVDRYRNVAHFVRGMGAPRVTIMEWIDPPFVSGHWIPQIVATAGGTNTLGFYRLPARQVEWADILDTRLHTLVVAACGFSVERQKAELEIIVRALGLQAAAREKVGAPRLFLCDGAHYFSRPGPRLVDTAELLAMLIHPELEAVYGSKFTRGIDYEQIEYGSKTYDRYRQPDWNWQA